MFDFTGMGDVDSVPPIEGESRQENPIDLITAVVLTVAFIATQLGLIPWVTKQ